MLANGHKVATGKHFELQWILYRSRRKDAPPLDARFMRGTFVCSNKAILLRCMRENGCFPLIEAQAALDGMPSTFEARKAAQPRDLRAALTGIPSQEAFGRPEIAAA